MENTDGISSFNFFSGYEFQNVLVYFMIVPLLWAVVIDYKWIRKPIATSVFVVSLVAFIFACGGLQGFTTWSFNAGVQFCAYWKKLGYTYAEACVVWCVIYPLLVSIIITLIPSRKRKKSGALNTTPAAT
ncbi:MAG TPA: hypothetical protein VK826_07080 [Bacteroidia bacterium]|nr:hypothetical protein [Bacteroidia bacterium]